MKITRTNKCKRIMKHYNHHYGYKTPYSILMTGSYCNEALQFKVQVKEQLDNYFSHEVRIVTTQCCIAEIELLSQINFGLQGGWLILKKFPTVKCGHEGRPVTSSVCLKQVLGGSGKYILASMDRELWKSVQKSKPGVPIVYQYGPAPTLIKPKILDEKMKNSGHVDEEEELENEHMNELIETIKKKQEKNKAKKKRREEEDQSIAAEDEENKRKREKKLAKKRKREEEQSNSAEEEPSISVKKQKRKKNKKSSVDECSDEMNEEEIRENDIDIAAVKDSDNIECSNNDQEKVSKKKKKKKLLTTDDEVPSDQSVEKKSSNSENEVSNSESEPNFQSCR